MQQAHNVRRSLQTPRPMTAEATSPRRLHERAMAVCSVGNRHGIEHVLRHHPDGLILVNGRKRQRGGGRPVPHPGFDHESVNPGQLRGHGKPEFGFLRANPSNSRRIAARAAQEHGVSASNANS